MLHFFIVVDKSNGNVMTNGLFTTLEKHQKALADWCRWMWKERMGTAELLPEDDEEAIGEYFEFWDDEERLETGEIQPDTKV